MSPFDSLDAFLISASTAFCSPLAIFVQIQGYVICLTLAIGWAFAAYVRSREIRRMKAHMKGGNSFAFLSHDINDLEHSNQVSLPRVTVVMPLKGFGEHNLHNWRSQITSLYGGPLEFHFVVESTEDPAYHAINRLLADYEIGVERMHKDSKYVLFLDDDVRLHPGSIGALTAEMEKNPEMHADDFRNDRHGVVSELRDGGYSDDMTLAAIAGAHKRLITSPPVAVFPHPLASDLSFSRYWNYLRKQTFVLESYTTKVNWIMNRALFSSHCYLSWGFVAPYIMAVVHVAAALRIHSKGHSLGDATLTSCGLSLAGCLAICTFVELLSMWNLTRIEVRLCNFLSPEAPPLSLASYNWCLIVRSKDKGPKFTDLGGKRLYGKKGAQPKASILGSLSRSLTQWRQPKKFDV
ncbi:nucleotide-diphospho-sugar transferases superfamily protein [Actinidia rufa]|uniref:ceramide glucosyltransferase n=1 Tax=Actinidia rufa TaxID=165716 RepID=A0A7J0E3W7_9ERIC|nr:nucleotide-diphospho-sugar transferases superfamily protein [Actinidia rufa]